MKTYQQSSLIPTGLYMQEASTFLRNWRVGSGRTILSTAGHLEKLTLRTLKLPRTELYGLLTGTALQNLKVVFGKFLPGKNLAWKNSQLTGLKQTRMAMHGLRQAAV